MMQSTSAAPTPREPWTARPLRFQLLPRQDGSPRVPGKLAMYDWFPIVFFIFKVLVLGIGMFFSIKWHHDQAKKDKEDRKPEP